MNPVIRDILDRKVPNADKVKALKTLEQEIKIAQGVIQGSYCYCEDCDDYFLKQSFTEESGVESCKICTYEDPINSGGNEYVQGIAHITYRVCPRGHRKETHRREEKKK